MTATCRQHSKATFPAGLSWYTVVEAATVKRGHAFCGNGGTPIRAFAVANRQSYSLHFGTTIQVFHRTGTAGGAWVDDWRSTPSVTLIVHRAATSCRHQRC